MSDTAIKEFDLVIVGGGPGGYVAAIRGAQMGARVALVEKEAVGGTCLNVGCIPTKALEASAEAAMTLADAAAFGITVGPVQVDFAAVARRRDEAVKRLVDGVRLLLKKNKVTLFSGTGRLLNQRTVEVTLAAGEKEALTAGKGIIIATGSRPAAPPSLGYNGTSVVTSDEALKWNEMPRRLVIVGGGVIGCEFASIFRALGSEVTVIEAMPRILMPVDEEIARLASSYLKRRGIKFMTQASVTGVRPGEDGVTVELASGETFTGDKVLISIGRAANTSGLGLEAAGVQVTQRGEIPVNARMETNVPGIWAVGDVTDVRIKLAHVASYQGIVAVENIMGQSRQAEYQAVPNCIFTHPEMAGVGITTQEAAAAGLEIKSGKFAFAANGRAVTMGQTEGVVKIIAEAATGKVLGVHIIGPHASSLIGEGTLAVNRGLTVEELARTIHPHPTLTEAVMEAAEAVEGRSIHA